MTQTNPRDLKRQGGAWMAEARTWMIWNILGGDELTWGSDNPIKQTLTVHNLEEFAAHVASAAINEERRRVQAEAVEAKRKETYERTSNS